MLWIAIAASFIQESRGKENMKNIFLRESIFNNAEGQLFRPIPHLIWFPLADWMILWPSLESSVDFWPQIVMARLEELWALTIFTFNKFRVLNSYFLMEQVFRVMDKTRLRTGILTL